MGDNPFDWQTRQNRRAQATAANTSTNTGHSRRPDHPESRSQHGQPPSSMKREGSKSRAPNLHPDFADVDSKAGDLERKNRPADRNFRDKRDGYGSDEGETHRHRTKPGRRRDYDDSSSEDESTRRRGERSSSHRPRRDAEYDESSRRRRDDDGHSRGGEATRHRDTDRHRHDRRKEYSSESDSERDRRPRRRPSTEDDRTTRYRSDGRREKDSRGEKDRYDGRRDTDGRDARRRREEIYDRDRDARRSGRRTYYERVEDEPRRAPRHIKVGKYDIGPYVEQGEKHYKTLAPVLKPIVMNMAKQYMAGKMTGSR